MKNYVEKYVPVILIIIVLFLLTNCEKKDTNSSGIHYDVVLVPESYHAINNTEFKVLLSCSPQMNGEWKANNTAEWLEITPESGTIGSEIIEIIMKTDTSKTQLNYSSTAVSFVLNNVFVNDVKVILQKRKALVGLSFFPEELIFDYGQDTSRFSLRNTGNQIINWSVGDIPAQLNFSVSSGTIDVGDSAIIDVEVDRLNMETGEIDFTVKFQTDSGFSKDLNIKVFNYNDQLTLLPFNVQNASYIKSNNEIVLIAYDPLKFVILDPETLETKELDISKVPLCFSVDPTGDYSVLGYSNNLILINNNSMSIVNNIPLVEVPFTVVVKNSEWAYIFPAITENGKTYYHVQSVNLITGEVFVSSYYISTSQYGVLHPSGNFIYSTAKQSGHYLKYSIQNASVEIVHEVNDWNLTSGGNIWITTDGSRLFTGGRLILRLSENPEQDLIYGGYIGDHGYLLSYDELTQQNLCFALFSSDDISQKLLIFTQDYTEPYDTLNLPYFFIPESPFGGNIYNSEGKYVFANDENNKVYVLQKAENNYPVYNEWGLSTFETGFFKK